MKDRNSEPSQVEFNYPKNLVTPQQGLYRAYHFKDFGHSGTIETIIFSSDEKFFITGGSDGTIKVWDFETKKLVRIFIHSGMVRKIFLTSGDKYLISCAFSKVIYIWDFHTGKIVRELNAEKNQES